MKMPRGAALAVLPLAVFVGLGLAFYARIGAGDPHVLPSALIGKPVPEFSLGAVSGLTTPGLSSADLKTGKMTLVNVYASWCLPCRSEHGLLTSIAKQVANGGAQLVGINYKDTSDAAARFITELGNPFSKIGADISGRAAIDWGVYGVPETYIVDGAGRVVFKHVGPLNLDVVGKDILPRLKGEK